MAKTILKNYNFHPGLGKLDKIYPNAYDLLAANVDFLIEESVIFLNEEIADSVKCKRDLRYILDGLTFDGILGSNYNARFLGIAQLNSLDVSPTVIRTIQRLVPEVIRYFTNEENDPDIVLAFTSVQTNFENFETEIINIIQNGRDAKSVLNLPVPGVSIPASRTAAKDRITNNVNFIIAEINAYVAATYPNNGHDVDKCSRDIEYALDGFRYDVFYGGNSATYDQAKFFFYYNGQGNTGIIPSHQDATVAAYLRLKNIIGDIVAGTTVAVTAGNNEIQDTSGNNPSSVEISLVQVYADILYNIIQSDNQNQADTYLSSISRDAVDLSLFFDPPYVQIAEERLLIAETGDVLIDNITFATDYTYNESKCRRDLKYILEGYLHDFRYGGNEKTYNNISYYWEDDVAQVDGNRIPEIDVHAHIGDLITDYVFTNTNYPSSNNPISQTIDLTKTAETGANNIIDQLVSYTTGVIANGLSSLPTFEETGLGYITFQGRYTLNDILLITNTTSNLIIYNFGTNESGGNIIYYKSYVKRNAEFPTFIQRTDNITVLELNFNTQNQNANDFLQIFVENTENDKSVLITRPYDFGTDAIERNRVAYPLSMLDADFEYGLQPTKWAAISTLRGYPSIYEIPGTDTSVESVVTDASATTNGVGQSIITVTTTTAHGFEVGNPITIKALADSIPGAARAEGAFVIINVPTPTTFQFFAKAKVGTSDGQILSTTYTQLREADFYTGATIGEPTFTVLSQGASGTAYAQLDVLAGSNIIPFDGDAPGIGSPVQGFQIATGSQVVSVRAVSNEGGNYITPIVVGDYQPGATAIQVQDSTGIIDDLALDRGDGVAIYVESVVGNTINLSSPLTNTLLGREATYLNISPIYSQSNGTNLEFTVSEVGGVYDVNVTNAGTNFKNGDKVSVNGADIGGLNVDNDLVVAVTAVNATGQVQSVIALGTPFTGAATIGNQEALIANNTGLGGEFDITFLNNAYTTGSIVNGGSGYALNDKILISGGNFPSGNNNTNDCVVTVISVSGGAITSISVSGTAPDATVSYLNPLFSTTSASGSINQLDITRTGTVYTVVITGSTNFVPTDTITIAGDQLGGAIGTNDCTINVSTTVGGGSIDTFVVTGTAVNTDTTTNLFGTNLQGSGGIFEIILNGGSYSIGTISLDSSGQQYAIGQQFTITGDNLLGATPTNDVLIEVTSANNGVLTGLSVVSGTAATTIGSYNITNPLQYNGNGSSATFTVFRSDGIYALTGTSHGTGYQYYDRLTIQGSDLNGGVNNNIDIIVKETDEFGGIQFDSSTTYDVIYSSAVEGTNFNLISTFTISENTTQYLYKNNSIQFSAIATGQISFPNPHGLVPGNSFITSIVSDDGVNNHNLLSGSFFVLSISDLQTLAFTARAEGFISTLNDPIVGVVYPRPDSFFIHRPYDGGVQLGTGGPQHGAQAIRQSKKYIRYQSGKGIMYTTGALFAPSYNIRSVTSDGIEVNSLITIIMDDNDHGVQEGGVIRLIGIETAGYNSGPYTKTPPNFDYTVTNVVDERTLQVRAQRRLGSTTAVLGFAAIMSVVSWHGATVRSGIFDDQNGIFWEYDGKNLSVVQRSGTKQVAGVVDVDVDSNLMTGTNTRFREQLIAGDRIILKGMTHVVSNVVSDTIAYITPDYRGVVAADSAKIALITDKRVPQNEFNIDRLDGTGPSGYEIDLSTMQMIGIQYSWYGAGFIDFMLRGANGNFLFAHRMRNSNINTEAFMRSGNLPVRYEVTNEGNNGKLSADMDDTQTYIPLIDSSLLPTYGTVYIDNELIVYTVNNYTLNRLENCTRAGTLTNFQAGALRNYTAGAATTHTKNTGVVLISQTLTPLISHWGSAFLTDGGFDEDRGYIFSYAATNIPVTTIPQTAFLIRLAPSVSNALIGDLGERELLNRAQLLLQGIELIAEAGSGGIIIEGILNPKNYPTNPNAVTWSNLSNAGQGGQPSFAQIASGGGIDWGATVVTATATVIDSIDTGNNNVYQIAQNGKKSPVIVNNYYNLTPVPNGSKIYSSNPNAFSDDLDATVEDYYVTNIQPYRFDPTDGRIFFQDVNGNNSARYQVTASTTMRFVYETYTGLTTKVLFDKADFDSTGATVGTSISSGETKFPAGTSITQINAYTMLDGGPLLPYEFYEVIFNQTSTTNITVGSTIEFELGAANYAEPGETVVSFIASPGERSTLDLSSLKELTNTPLGGRGTYPNGPDILALNVFKVTGAALDASIILRWGEAQA